MIKRTLALIVAAFSLVAVSMVGAQGGKPEIPAHLPDLKGREVVAVTAQDYTPLTFVDTTTNKGVGMEIEIWDEICLRLNCKLTWKVAAWDGMIVAINQKQYDVGMDGISITDERKKQVDFSDEYLAIEQHFLVRSDESGFKDKASFVANKALKIGAQAGTSGYFTAADMLGLKENETSDRIVFYSNFGISVQALLNKDVDAVIGDSTAGRGYIGANAGKLKMLDEVLSSDSLGFIFPQGSDLVAPVNAALKSMKDDGFLAYEQNKWFFLYDPSVDVPAAATPAK